MNWQVTILRGPVPPIPDSLIKDIAALLLQSINPEIVTLHDAAGPMDNADEGEMEPVEIEQLADSEA